MAEVNVLESTTPNVNEEQAIGVYSGKGGVTSSFCGCGCNAVEETRWSWIMRWKETHLLWVYNAVDRIALIVGNAVNRDTLVVGNAVDRDALVVGNAVDREALVVVLFARASTVAMCCIAPASAVARFGTEGQEAWGGRAGAGGPLFVQPPLRPGKQVVH